MREHSSPHPTGDDPNHIKLTKTAVFIKKKKKEKGSINTILVLKVLTIQNQLLIFGGADIHTAE